MMIVPAKTPKTSPRAIFMMGVVVRSRTVSTAFTMASAAWAGQSPPASDPTDGIDGMARGGVADVSCVEAEELEAFGPVSIMAILTVGTRG
jgi:hypothetical protein